MIRSPLTRTMQAWDRFLATRSRRWRNVLVETYFPIVQATAVDLASRIPRWVEPEDLASVGVFGLLQAIEAYDPRRKVKFETFCRPRIRGAMIDELRSSDRLTREARGRVRALAGVRARLRQELLREPNHHEVAQRIRLKPRDVEGILAGFAAARVLSLDVSTGDEREDEEPLLLGDDLVDQRVAPMEEAQRNDLLALIDEQLTAEERQLLQLRYGADLPMARIGRELGLTESRVSQLHSKLLNRLHRKLAAES